MTLHGLMTISELFAGFNLINTGVVDCWSNHVTECTQNAPFRGKKIQKFPGDSPLLHCGASILTPSALDLPPKRKSRIRQCSVWYVFCPGWHQYRAVQYSNWTHHVTDSCIMHNVSNLYRKRKALFHVVAMVRCTSQLVVTERLFIVASDGVKCRYTLPVFTVLWHPCSQGRIRQTRRLPDQYFYHCWRLLSSRAQGWRFLFKCERYILHTCLDYFSLIS